MEDAVARTQEIADSVNLELNLGKFFCNGCGDDVFARCDRTVDFLQQQVVIARRQQQCPIDGFPRDWFGSVRHAFLIRHPARVVASYAAKRERPVLDDIGFRQQAEIFDEVRAAGQTPVVVDSFDIRADPERTLRALCAGLDLDWTPAMLSWPRGGHSSDGVWAAHWYGAVHASTGFAAPEGDLPNVDPDLQPVVDAAMPYYEKLSAYKL